MTQRKVVLFEEEFLQQVSGSEIHQMTQYLLEITDKINNVMICGQRMEPFWTHSLLPLLPQIFEFK